MRHTDGALPIDQAARHLRTDDLRYRNLLKALTKRSDTGYPPSETTMSMATINQHYHSNSLFFTNVLDRMQETLQYNHYIPLKSNFSSY